MVCASVVPTRVQEKGGGWWQKELGGGGSGEDIHTLKTQGGKDSIRQSQRWVRNRTLLKNKGKKPRVQKSEAPKGGK